MTQAKMGRAAGGNSNKAGKGTNSTAHKQQPPPAGVSARNAQGGRKRGGGAGLFCLPHALFLWFYYLR